MYPYPIFTIFGNDVMLYGVCIAVGIIACLIAFYIFSKKFGMPEKVQDYVFFILIGGLATGFLSAMVFQGFYNWLDGKPFKIIGAGLTVMGGLIGGAGCFLILYFAVGKFYFKGKEKGLHKKHFNTLLRIAPACICIAHAFGRIGCLMAGCCHGAYLGQEFVFGGLYMDGTTHGWGYYVPIQLYESLFLFALATTLIVLYLKRCNITMSIYLIGYGVWRFIVEFLRTDYRGFNPTLYPSQWLSILFVLGGIALMLIYRYMKIPFILPKKEQEKVENKQ